MSAPPSENYAAWIAQVRETNPQTGDWLRDTQALLLRFLKDVFFQMDRSDHRNLHWEPTLERTEIEIKAGRRIASSSVDRRPALVLNRGGFRYGVTSVDLRQFMDLTTGEEHHTDLLFGHYVVHCVAKEDLVAESLAVWVARSFRHFRRMLRQAGAFQIGRHIAVGPVEDAASVVSGAAADAQYVQVRVELPGVFQESVGVSISTPTLAGDAATLLRARGTFVGDRNTRRPYYPAQVNDDGLPEGANVILQPED